MIRFLSSLAEGLPDQIKNTLSCIPMIVEDAFVEKTRSKNEGRSFDRLLGQSRKEAV